MSSPRLTQGDNSKSHEWHSHLDLEKNESLVPPHTRATLNDHAELRPRKAPNGPGNTDWKLHSGVNEGLRGTKRVISDEMIESKTQSNTKTPETTYAMYQNELCSMAVIGLDAPLDRSAMFLWKPQELLTKHSVPDMETFEIKFREHRDSVAVARSRMSRNGILLNQREGIPIIQIDRYRTLRYRNCMHPQASRNIRCRL